MRGFIAALLLASAGLAGCAQAQPSSPPRSEAVRRAEARLDSLQRNEALIRELAGMSAVDQFARNAVLDARRGASAEDRAALDGLFRTRVAPIDASHVARLKALLEGRGWFRLSEVGDPAASAAFLIVQHSGDLPLMERVLRDMEALPREEVDGQDYALLYDRTALMQGRPQRYGTQGSTCTADGRFAVPADLESPAGVDSRRAAVGLMPIAQYLAGMDRMYGRCEGPRLAQ